MLKVNSEKVVDLPLRYQLLTSNIRNNQADWEKPNDKLITFALLN